MRRTFLFLFIASWTSSLSLSVADAATLGEKCEASKSKLSGSFFACREKAEATAILKGSPVDFTKCDSKFDEKFEAAETRGEGECPDVVSTPSMKAFLASQATTAAAILAGGAIPGCGDNVVNSAGEQCDGTDLGGATCASLGHASGSLACNGSCEFDPGSCDGCPGVEAYGACWVLAAGSAGCDTTCSGLGLAYDSATETVAGSGGSTEVCDALLDLVAGFGPAPTETACGSGWGCLYTPVLRFRCTAPATTASASGGGAQQRLCGCQFP